MPTRRDRIITSSVAIEGDWMFETTGFFGSSKNSAFIARSLVQRGLSRHVFDLSAPGGRKYRLEQGDIVHELVGGDRIPVHAAHGSGEGNEVVLHRLRGRNVCGRSRSAVDHRGY